MNEQFSAFLDNETTRDESDAVISALLRDESLRDSWTRQHHIRDVLRASTGDTVASIDMGFSARVMQAVHEDASAPRPARPATASPNVVSMGQGRRRRRRWHNMAGLAVAASAAGVAFFVMQPAQLLTATNTSQPAMTTQQATGTGTTTVATADTAPVPELHFATAEADDSGYSTPWDWAGGLVRSVASRVDQSANHWAVSDPTLANRLNDFLVEHNGLARGYGLGATTPGFVRVATYGQDFAQ